ncbi:MAG: tyrosine-type recombinase/integrase [Lachnospiraceae bacterium]|nr:tyrosine-type recombinase/integrase [Lachnospiraceae bacterium]
MFDKINAFSEYLKASGVSDNTALSYRRDLKQFALWLSDSFPGYDTQDISQVMTERYVEELMTSERSTATISRCVTSFRKFFSWAYAKGYIFNDPSVGLKAPKVIKNMPATADIADIERLVNAVNHRTAKGKRDIAIIRLISSTGISSAELLSLKTTDIDLKKRQLRAGIKNKRMLNIDKKTFSALKQYLLKGRDELLNMEADNTGNEVPISHINSYIDNELLFLSCGGSGISRQGLWKILKKYSELAGIGKNVTPEMLRHSYAVLAIKEGEEISDLQKKLGHITNNSATEYAEIAKRHLR